MTSSLRHPALILATLAVMSGSLGTYAQGPAFGDAPHFGAYMMLTGVWFGLVVALGVWLWGNRSARAAATALMLTWGGWESAVNLAMQLDHHLHNTIITSDAITVCVSGMCAGALGAFATWAGAAPATPILRQTWLALGIASTGALLGPLLQLSNHYDNAAVLLLPWQIAVAALLGVGLAPPRRSAVAEGNPIFEPEHRPTTL